MSTIINTLDALLTHRKDDIEAWLHAERTHKRPFLYSSVDLRHSGYKIAPVDTNLFPAGFNNLSNAAYGRAVHFLGDRLGEMHPHVQRVLIIPENHTRNLGYLENLYTLAKIITDAGMEVKIGNLTITEPLQLTTLKEHHITEYPLQHTGNRLVTSEGFVPDLIILNNDCTAGKPELLEGIAQPIEPHYMMGWYRRRKSEHFRCYAHITHRFAEVFHIDPWLITAEFHRCGVVNFQERKGIECVALGVERILHTTRQKYQEYGIKEEPYVFIKADSGTYGMGIMTVRSADELIELNKKTRNKMNVIKEGTQNTEVIIQEGIPTIDVVENAPAEAMVYAVDGIPIGGAYRINSERDTQGNLNAAGMRFVGMCDEGECAESAKERIRIPHCNFSVFGLLTALATLAASHEVYDGLDIGFEI